MLRLLMASEDGYLYVFSLDCNDGGDCPLIRQFHLSRKDEPSTSSTAQTPEAVKMEQQQLEATDQVDQADAADPDNTSKPESSEFPIQIQA